ncbi:MAG: TdeIII family type II restriction endonuclease [Bacteroidetes bacterium]|nr:MAG: TdeIII family type II restriction endonuclease [Bacteroidota bacterium]
MALSKQQIQSVEETIKSSIRKRFATYNPEPAVMPFHTRLLGKDRLALYSFIHSLNTNFGTTIFEPVAVLLASTRFKIAKLQMKSGTKISEQAQYEIQKIMDELTTANKKPDKKKEIEIIRKVCQKGEMRTIKPTRVDVYLERNDGEIYLIDIKTAKPNKGGFKEFKRTLLEWTATVLAENPKAKINTLIAIPYNPYEPKPYSRWTMAGMLDLDKELKVAEEFWDFLGGEDAYNDLLGCFERVGIDMREEIDKYFEKFK